MDCHNDNPPTPFVCKLTASFVGPSSRPGSPVWSPGYEDVLPYGDRPEYGEEITKTFKITLMKKTCQLLHKINAVNDEGNVDLGILKRNNKDNLFDEILKYETDNYGSSCGYSYIHYDSIKIYQKFSFPPWLLKKH